MKNINTLPVCIPMAALTIVLASGCATPPRSPDQTYFRDLELKENEIRRLKEALESKNAEAGNVDMQEGEIIRLREALTAQTLAEKEQKKLLAETHKREIEALQRARFTPGDTADVAGSNLLPPNAKPGECYARVYVPPTFKVIEEDVLVQDASERVEIIPAEYEWVEEEVVVQEATDRMEVVPATFEKRDEQVLVKPKSTRTEQVEAQYEWVEEKVLIRPARTEWKKGKGPIQQVDNATGEIMCLIEVPAEYNTIRKKVLKSPATTRTIEVPAEYATVSKTVMLTPETIRKVSVPAVTKTVRIKKEVKPAEKRVTPIEATYATVQKKVHDQSGGIAWRRVICETNLRGEIVKRIQMALKEAGHEPGAIDGIIGPMTDTAIREYQLQHKLAVGGLTFETLRQLGVDLDID